jgi:hypothetical protein
MKNLFQRCTLAFAASSLVVSAPLAQEAQQPPTPANQASDTAWGVAIPPQNFPAPREEPRRWDTDAIENAPVIAVPEPRRVPRGAINIGPISVREGERDRLRPGCRWTVRDETLQRRCRF